MSQAELALMAWPSNWPPAPRGAGQWRLSLVWTPFRHMTLSPSAIMSSIVNRKSGIALYMPIIIGTNIPRIMRGKKKQQHMPPAKTPAS